ncbi:RRM domain-containing protein [Caerostris darwini]|uniref:RRM domain-containing protein n=1 Tax=Caerostris darwini TaxID=1538125 RepID=A0AAV4THZ5_9ARAC|nr:RRM domain-containing protein [Caerostris darwini]
MRQNQGSCDFIIPQNQVREHLQILSTGPKREQKFAKDETENRRVPILKINLRQRTVCEVKRADYLNQTVASKNQDDEDKNISSSERIFRKFANSTSGKKVTEHIIPNFVQSSKTKVLSSTKNVGLKSLVENTDVKKKRQSENLNDFSVSELNESLSERKDKKRKLSISESGLQEPHHDIIDSSKSNSNELVKYIGNCNSVKKGTENISSVHTFRNEILNKTAVVKSSKLNDSNIGGNEKIQKRKTSNFSDSELQKSISEGKQKKRKRNNSGSNFKKSPLQVQQCSKVVPPNFYISSDLKIEKLDFTKKCDEMEKFIKNKRSVIPISRNEVSHNFIENVAVETSFLINWDHNYSSSDFHKSSTKFKPYSVKINDHAGNVKEICDKYMNNYIEYKKEKYINEEYTDEKLVHFPQLSDIEIYFKQDLPDIGTLLCPINIDSCLQMGVSHQEEVTTSESETSSLQMGVSHQEEVTSASETSCLSNDIFLNIKNLPLEFVIHKFLFSDCLFDLKYFLKENNHSSSMPVKKSTFHRPVVKIHCNTANAINNKSENVVKGQSIIQNGKQLVNTNKPVVLNVCTYDKISAKNKQATYIGNSAVHAQTNKKPAVNTDNNVNGQATYKRAINIGKSNVNDQTDIKQTVNRATCNVKTALKKTSSFDMRAYLSLPQPNLNFKISKKSATSNAKTSPLENKISRSPSNQLNPEQVGFGIKEKEKDNTCKERCTVYVGNIPLGYTEDDLRQRFEQFGKIKNIHLKPRKNYGFVIYSSQKEAALAIDSGNKGYQEKLKISFGGRREFVGTDYTDLDGYVARNEENKHILNYRARDESEGDYELLLNQELKKRGLNRFSSSKLTKKN